jgi:hypothetical protein
MMEQEQLELPMRKRVRLGEDELSAERTEWDYDTDPPMPGWWEVRLREEPKTERGRWWWSGVEWHTSQHLTITLEGDRIPRVITADTFRRLYAWRGLLEPSPDVYPCPPYQSTVLAIAAQSAQVALRTMYVAITRPQRVRNRL